jgi:hypothetical protein
MNAIQTKQHLHRLIDEISDDALLKSVEALVVSEVAQDEQPMTIEEMFSRIARSQEDIEARRLTAQKDLEKESETW